MACSKNILDAFEKNKEQFLVNSMNNSNYLEDISGITNIMSSVKITSVESGLNKDKQNEEENDDDFQVLDF